MILFIRNWSDIICYIWYLFIVDWSDIICFHIYMYRNENISMYVKIHWDTLVGSFLCCVCEWNCLSYAPTITNISSKGQGKGEDINSSQENKNLVLVLSLQLALVTLPLHCRVQHPWQRERPLLCVLKEKTCHICRCHKQWFYNWTQRNWR